jgi:ketosteroid isomerase-like protein
MLKITHAAILLVLLGAGAVIPAWAADTKILDHHVANMKAGNLDGVLSDYAPDAVVVTPAGMITPDGVFVGSETRKLFSVLTDKDHLPGNKTMLTRYEKLSPDTTLMHWVQFKGTAKEVSGYDVFVVRGGKVAFQTVVVNPAKK